MKKPLLGSLLTVGALLVLLALPAWAAETDPAGKPEVHAEITSLEITARDAAGDAFDFSDSILVPALSGGTVSETTVVLTAILTYNNDASTTEDVTSKVVWGGVSNLPEGIRFQDSTLTVTSAAPEFTIVSVTASYHGCISDPYHITVEREEAQATRIEITDPAVSIRIPEAGAAASVQTYTAKIFDQYGAEMEGEAVCWKLTPPADGGGTAWDENSGTLTVSAGAAETAYTLTATDATKTVTASVIIYVAKLRFHDLTFARAGIDAVFGERPPSQTATHAGDCGCGGAAVRYRSSDETVLAVEADTGALSLPRKVGTVKITAVIEGTAAYAEASAEYTVTVRPADLSAVGAVADIPPQTYTGSAICPPVTVTAYGRVLTAAEGYTVGCTGNIAVGTATVTVTGQGGYTGTLVKTFSIEKAAPAVTGVAAEGAVYPSTGPENVRLTGRAEAGGREVAGVLALEAGQTLTAGSGVYRWTFTPEDGESYRPVSGTVTIQVLPREVAGIEVSGEAKRAYVYGDRFDPAGLTVTAVYTDGGREDVTSEALFNGGKPLSVGQTEVPVSYGGGEAAITGVTVGRKAVPYAASWGERSFLFDGGRKSVALTGLPEEAEAVYEGAAATDAGTYRATAAVVLAEGYSAENYELRLTGDLSADWVIRQAEGGRHTVSLSARPGAAQTVDLTAYLPDNCGAVTRPPAVTASAPIAEASADAGGRALTFALSADAAGGDTAAITCTVSTRNYTDITVTVAVRVTERSVPELSAADFTAAYTGRAVSVDELTKSASFDGRSVEGTWSFEGGRAPVGVADSGVYRLLFTPADRETYADGASVSLRITVEKAKPSGTPGYQPIAAPGSTLADAKLVLGGITPAAGSLSWDLDGGTEVRQGTSYAWTFTPDDPNYAPLTGSVVLWPRSAGSDSRPGSGSSGNGGGSGFSGSQGSGGGVSTGSGTAAGGAVQTTVRPDAVLSGSAASVRISAAVGRELAEQAARHSSPTVAIIPSIGDQITSVTVTVPGSAVEALSRETAADLSVDTPVARVLLPHAALGGLGRGETAVFVQRRGNTLTVAIESGGRRVDRVEGSVTVTVPASGGPGTVALLLDSAGNRTVLRRSVFRPDEGALTVPLEGSAVVELIEGGGHFADVPGGSWFAGAVDFVSARGLLGGGAPAFSPKDPMTRGMAAAVFYRLEGSPGSAGGGFADVPAGAWYAEAVRWAADSGIVRGLGGGRFGGERAISRQDLTLLLWNYAGRPEGRGDLSRFTDAGSVSGYALAALRWAVEAGVVNGRGQGLLAPDSAATRAEAAQMIENFMERVR